MAQFRILRTRTTQTTDGASSRRTTEMALPTTERPLPTTEMALPTTEMELPITEMELPITGNERDGAILGSGFCSIRSNAL